MLADDWAVQQYRARQERLKRKREKEDGEVLVQTPVVVCDTVTPSLLVPPKAPPAPTPVVIAVKHAVEPAEVAPVMIARRVAQGSQWSELYRPVKLHDVVGNRRAKDKAIEWAQQSEHAVPLLLVGPVGIGKTSLAHALCRAQNWSVVDAQSAAGDMMHLITEVCARKVTAGMPVTALVLDEVDVWHGNERTALAKVIKRGCKVPIVLVCEELGKNMEMLKSVCCTVRMYRSDKEDEVRAIARRLESVTGKRWSSALLTHVSKVCSGDLRKAVFMLESGASAGADVFIDSVFDATECILSKYPRALSVEQCEGVYKQHDLMPFMLHENLHARHSLDLSEWFSTLDILDSHASHQLHAYPGAISAHLLTALPAVPQRAPTLQFPSALSCLSKRKGRQSLLNQLNLNFQDWSLVAPLTQDPKIFSWLCDATKYAPADLRKALKSNKPLQSVLGTAAR